MKVKVRELFENHRFVMLNFLQYRRHKFFSLVDDELELNYRRYSTHIYHVNLNGEYDVSERVFDRLRSDRVRLRRNLDLNTKKNSDLFVFVLRKQRTRNSKDLSND